MSRRHKHLDFEINLIPFIDLLSVCICFLLLTAVWLNVGSVDVKQAVGGQPASETERKPTVWVFVDKAGNTRLELKDAPQVPSGARQMKIAGLDGRVDFLKIGQVTAELKKLEPNLRTALIQPSAETVYEDIIAAMDNMKKSGILDLGVAPL